MRVYGVQCAAIIDQLKQTLVAKRRLNKQQKARIQNKQDDISNQNTSNQLIKGRAGNQKASKMDDSQLGNELTGLTISHFRAQADIECATSGDIVRCHLRANLPGIVTGDRVIWRRGKNEQSDSGIVEAINPRSSELCRPDSYGKMKLVGSNVTRAIIVIAPEPQAHSNLIDRYLVIAEYLGLEPLLLLNKADLLADNSPTQALLNKYQALGYQSLAVSSTQNTGMSELQAAISHGCSIFVGQSGVGKSSIIQALLPGEDIKVGELSEAARQGRHTTTHARLYHFPTGGDCIDSPGIREFGLWHLEPEHILEGFVEFRPFIGHCKFRNCTHINDAHCAISQAVETGDISQERYQSFVCIVKSLNDVTIQNGS